MSKGVTRARGQRSLYRGGGIRTNDPQVREADAGDGDESNQAGERRGEREREGS